MSGMNLGELIDTFAALPGAYPVVLSDGKPPSHLTSWRGVYADLSIVPDGGKPISCGEFLRMLTSADGDTFEGYKGGSYRMERRTPVWVSEEGNASHVRPVGVVIRGGSVVLACECEDGW